MKSFIRINQVMERVSFGKSKIWKMVKDGEFPQPIKLTSGTTVWIKEEVDKWIEDKVSEHRSKNGGAS